MVRAERISVPRPHYLPSKREKTLRAGVLLIIILSIFTPFAVAEESLTRMFDTSGLQGSWSWIEKLSWIGWFSQGLISVMGALSLSIILWRKVVTIFYLAGRTFWDNVDESKQSSGSGTGMNADRIMQSIYKFLPNFKAMSDYNSKGQYNLSEDDDVWEYITKTAVHTIGIIVFSALAFSGALGQLYGYIAEFLIVGFSNIEKLQLVESARYMVEKGQGFRFTYGQRGTELGKFQQRTADSIYMQLSVKAKLKDTNEFYNAGAQVNKWVEELTSNGSLSSMITNQEKPDWKKDEIYKGFSPVVRVTTAKGDGKLVKSKSFKELGVNATDSDKWYISVSFNYTAPSSSPFKIDKSK